MISDFIKKQIKAHAEENPHEESCGFVLVDSIVRCSNVSENPSGHFTISPFQYLKASRKDKIKAVYHSHISNNNKFSPEDKKMSRGHNLPFVLYHLKTKNFLCFDPKKERIVDIDKKFELGKRDCYTLVKDYYRNLGVQVTGNNGLGERWLKKNPFLIQDLFDLNQTALDLGVNNPEHTVIEREWLGMEMLKKHDVIVFEMIKGDGPCHVGVYLGDGIMYHHPRNRFPTTESLSPVIQRKIYKIYRHTQIDEQS